MNRHALARDYHLLTAEERLPLFMNARGRGDAPEAERLAESAPRMQLTVAHHFPFAQAFREHVDLFFMKMLDTAAEYLLCLAMADVPDEEVDGVPRSFAAEHRELALLWGFILKTDVQGWQLFCERRHLLPFRLWQLYPGWERLQSALESAKEAAFDETAFVQCLNRRRSNDTPEVTRSPFRVEATANALELAFRDRVRSWGGAEATTGGRR
jgi:hypothetical protein